MLKLAAMPHSVQPPDEHLSVGAAAALLQISPDTLKRWEAKGHITAIRTPTGHRRFRRRDVEALLAGEAAS